MHVVQGIEKEIERCAARCQKRPPPPMVILRKNYFGLLLREPVTYFCAEVEVAEENGRF